MYSEIKKDIWTEDSANQAILNILKGVNSLTPKMLIFVAIKINIFNFREKLKKIYKQIFN